MAEQTGFLTRTAVRECSETIVNAVCKLIDLLGFCELLNAKARYQAQKCSQEDEIIKSRKSDKYGDHVHLTMCIKAGTQSCRQGFSIADLIAQTEFRQATNPAEYMKTSKGKALNLGVNAFHDMESSRFQQSPVISRLQDVMLPTYSGDLDDLVKSTRTQTSSDRKAPERTSHDSGSVTGHGLDKPGLVPTRQNQKSSAITSSDLSKRTEEEWEYMSSHEERYVTLGPLLDACEACKKEKGWKKRKRGMRRTTAALRATEGIIGPEFAAGAIEIAEQRSGYAFSGRIREASRSPAPDDAIFLEFTEQARDFTHCTPISKLSNVPGSNTQVFDQTSEDNLGVLETTDTQILQPAETVHEDMREDDLGALDSEGSHPLQYDGVSLQQMEKETTSLHVTEFPDGPESDVQLSDNMSEDNPGELETREARILQYDGACSEGMGEKTPDTPLNEASDALELENRLLELLSEYIKANPEPRNTQCSHDHGTLCEQTRESTPGMQAREGAYTTEPRINLLEQATEIARYTQQKQATVALQQYWDFLDQISETPLRFDVPEETGALEPYVDILRRCPFSEKIELRVMNEIFATPEPLAQVNTQAKQSLPSLPSKTGPNAIGSQRRWPEQTTPRVQLPKGTDAPEPYVDILRRCPLSEKIELEPMNEIFATRKPIAKAIHQASLVDRIDLLRLPEGTYPRKPSTETKVAGQTPPPLQGLTDRVGSLQPLQPIGGYQRCLPSKNKAYGRDRPSGPPVQAFPPAEPQKDPQQKAKTGNIGAPVQQQPQPKAPPLFSYLWFKLQNESRQGGYSGNVSRQIQTPFAGRPTKSISAPMRQQGQHQANVRATTDRQLVPISTRSSVSSFPRCRLQESADVRGPLIGTGK